jgi:hypothetical protein
MNAKIKVSAPRENPHICYIGREYESKVKEIRKATGMSLYNLLCSCSGYLLNEKENIRNFKEKLRKNGFKNIGDWAECLIDFLFDHIEEVNSIDLTSIELKRKED